MEEIQAEDVYNKWLYELDALNRYDRYAYSERRNHIDLLVQMFYNAGISISDAKLYKKKVIKALVTKAGQANKGKFKGWSDTVERDFLYLVANRYIDDEEFKSEKKDKKINISDDFSYIPETKDITDWVINKFGENGTKDLVRETHRIQSKLHIDFLEELYNNI